VIKPGEGKKSAVHLLNTQNSNVIWNLEDHILYHTYFKQQRSKVYTTNKRSQEIIYWSQFKLTSTWGTSIFILGSICWKSSHEAAVSSSQVIVFKFWRLTTKNGNSILAQLAIYKFLRLQRLPNSSGKLERLMQFEMSRCLKFKSFLMEFGITFKSIQELSLRSYKYFNSPISWGSSEILWQLVTLSFFNEMTSHIPVGNLSISLQ